MRQLTHPYAVFSLAFGPDGRLLASAGAQSIVQLWEVATGAKVQTLTGDTIYVRSVAFSPDGTLIASAGGGKMGKRWQSGDKTVKLWG